MNKIPYYYQYIYLQRLISQLCPTKCATILFSIQSEFWRVGWPARWGMGGCQILCNCLPKSCTLYVRSAECRHARHGRGAGRQSGGAAGMAGTIGRQELRKTGLTDIFGRILIKHLATQNAFFSVFLYFFFFSSLFYIQTRNQAATIIINEFPKQKQI